MCKTIILGHRGASAYAPENTLPAFLLAKEQGADGIELDVQLTADGQLVVVHDERLERVSNGNGYVMDYTLEELKKLNFSKTIPGYEETQIPTLREVYACMKDSHMLINVELKTGLIWYENIEEKVLKETADCEMEQQVIYSSFNHQSLKKLKTLKPDVKTGMLFSDIIYNIDSYANKLEVDALHPALYYMKMEEKFLKNEKSHMPMRVWTVNEQKDLEWLMKQQIDTVITNKPDLAVKVRESLL